MTDREKNVCIYIKKEYVELRGGSNISSWDKEVRAYKCNNPQCSRYGIGCMPNTCKNYKSSR